MVAWCGAIRLFAAAARDAGPDLDRRTFVQAMSRIRDFPGTLSPTLSYGPDKFYGPTQYQVVKIHNNDPPVVAVHPEARPQPPGHVLGRDPGLAPRHDDVHPRSDRDERRPQPAAPELLTVERLDDRARPRSSSSIHCPTTSRRSTRGAIGRPTDSPALLGPDPAAVPLDVEIGEATPCDGYVRHRLVFDSEATMSVPAWLLVPSGRARARVRRRRPSTVTVPARTPICALADRRGRVAGRHLRPRSGPARSPRAGTRPALLRGARDWNPDDHYACDTNLVHATMMGATRSPRTCGTCRAASTSSRPIPSSTPVGSVQWASPTAGPAPSSWRPPTRGSPPPWSAATSRRGRRPTRCPWNMCGSQVMFGQLGQIEHVDVGALIVPRPLLVESADEDFLFPVATARASVAALRRVYDRAGASGRAHALRVQRHAPVGRRRRGGLPRHEPGCRLS